MLPKHTCSCFPTTEGNTNPGQSHSLTFAVRNMVWKCLVWPGVRDVLTTCRRRKNAIPWRTAVQVKTNRNQENWKVQTLCPTRPLRREDFPTFGCPKITVKQNSRFDIQDKQTPYQPLPPGSLCFNLDQHCKRGTWRRHLQVGTFGHYGHIREILSPPSPTSIPTPLPPPNPTQTAWHLQKQLCRKGKKAWGITSKERFSCFFVLTFLEYKVPL